MSNKCGKILKERSLAILDRSYLIEVRVKYQEQFVMNIHYQQESMKFHLLRAQKYHLQNYSGHEKMTLMGKRNVIVTFRLSDHFFFNFE